MEGYILNEELRIDRTDEHEKLSREMAEWEKTNKVTQCPKQLTRKQARNLSKGEKKAATYMTTVSYGSF